MMEYRNEIFLLLCTGLFGFALGSFIFSNWAVTRIRRLNHQIAEENVKLFGVLKDMTEHRNSQNQLVVDLHTALMAALKENGARRDQSVN